MLDQAIALRYKPVFQFPQAPMGCHRRLQKASKKCRLVALWTVLRRPRRLYPQVERLGGPLCSNLEFTKPVIGLNPKLSIPRDAAESEVNMRFLLPIPIPSVQHQGVGMLIQVDSPLLEDGFNQREPLIILQV